MSKTYTSLSSAKTQLTKGSKKSGVPIEIVQTADGYEIVATPAPAGWTEVETSVEEVQQAPRIDQVEHVELPVVVADSMMPATRTVQQPKPVNTVTLYFALNQMQPAYLECWHEGKLTWFAKESLLEYCVDGNIGAFPMATVTMLRSKAVRRRLVQPAA